MSKKNCILVGALLILLTGFLHAELGDTNGDNIVSIVDALMVAQKYVDLNPQPFLNINSDVNGDAAINIIDALMIAQKFVGLLGQFPNTDVQLPVFQSEAEFIAAFENTREKYYSYWMGPVLMDGVFFLDGGGPVPAMPEPAPRTEGSDDYSTTNVQVEGVDEADIIKTDGNYVYMLAQGELIIADAYPPAEGRIVSRTALSRISPLEMFINGDTLLVFGTTRLPFSDILPHAEPIGAKAGYYYYPSYTNVVTARLFDITDRSEPRLMRNVEIEGNYLSSRKIGDYAYFIINSYPCYYIDLPTWDQIVPMFRDTRVDSEPVLADMEPIAPYNEIGYVEPIQAQQFLTVASISMADAAAEVKKEVIIGSGQEIYASLENIYIAQQSWPLYLTEGSLLPSYKERTYLTKFNFSNGDMKYAANGSVKGHILNQFSMDEFEGHFRIATTRNNVWNSVEPATNNVYVLDADLKLAGRLEGLAPGESIYAVRFAGKKGYLVTFIKIDPLFVLDLSDHTNPRVLGELKVPGYSDYLHPYDENHIIGIGKNTAGGNEFFTWYQGIKIALFDVTDVNNPVEMYTESIGHRGTDSEALHNHKAFLFDREKNLLAIPITLAEIEGEPISDNQYGEVTFQGAFVYDLSLEEGFALKGRITHHDDFAAPVDNVYYLGRQSAIRRCLYIDTTLYSFSENRLQGNDLDTMARVMLLDF